MQCILDSKNKTYRAVSVLLVALLLATFFPAVANAEELSENQSVQLLAEESGELGSAEPTGDSLHEDNDQTANSSNSDTPSSDGHKNNNSDPNENLDPNTDDSAQNINTGSGFDATNATDGAITDPIVTASSNPITTFASTENIISSISPNSSSGDVGIGIDEVSIWLNEYAIFGTENITIDDGTSTYSAPISSGETFNLGTVTDSFMGVIYMINSFKASDDSALVLDFGKTYTITAPEGSFANASSGAISTAETSTFITKYPPKELETTISPATFTGTEDVTISLLNVLSSEGLHLVRVMNGTKVLVEGTDYSKIEESSIKLSKDYLKTFLGATSKSIAISMYYDEGIAEASIQIQASSILKTINNQNEEDVRDTITALPNPIIFDRYGSPVPTVSTSLGIIQQLKPDQNYFIDSGVSLDEVSKNGNLTALSGLSIVDGSLLDLSKVVSFGAISNNELPGALQGSDNMNLILEVTKGITSSAVLQIESSQAGTALAYLDADNNQTGGITIKDEIDKLLSPILTFLNTGNTIITGGELISSNTLTHGMNLLQSSPRIVNLQVNNNGALINATLSQQGIGAIFTVSGSVSTDLRREPSPNKKIDELINNGEITTGAAIYFGNLDEDIPFYVDKAGSLSLDSSDFVLNVGDMKEINALFPNANNVNWSSSNPNVASIERPSVEGGPAKVTANKTGTAIITAKSTANPALKISLVCTVIPKDANTNSYIIKVGEKTNFDIPGQPPRAPNTPVMIEFWESDPAEKVIIWPNDREGYMPVTFMCEGTGRAYIRNATTGVYTERRFTVIPADEELPPVGLSVESTTTYVVVCSVVNKRTGPGTSFSKVAPTLKRGDTIEVSEVVGGWAKYKIGEQVYYSSLGDGKYLQVK